MAIFILGLGFVSGFFYGLAENNSYPSPVSNKQKENIVLTAGEYDFNYDEVKHFLFVRLKTSGFTREKIEKRIERLVFDELLYQEALVLGMANNPEIRPKFRQIVADHFIWEKVRENLKQAPVKQDEIRSYYEQNQQQFHREEQLRTADIFISSKTKNAKQQALALLKKAKNSGKRRAAFGQLIKQSSDNAPYFSKGNSGFFDRKGNNGKIPIEYAEAAFTLKRIGDIHPTLVETEAGYHVLMLIGRRPALHRSLPVVQKQIKKILEDEKRQTFRQEYADKLRSKFKVEQSRGLTDKLLKEADTLVARRHSPPTFPSQ